MFPLAATDPFPEFAAAVKSLHKTALRIGAHLTQLAGRSRDIRYDLVVVGGPHPDHPLFNGAAVHFPAVHVDTRPVRIGRHTVWRRFSIARSADGSCHQGMPAVRTDNELRNLLDHAAPVGSATDAD